MKLVEETRAFQIYDVRVGAGASEADHVHARSVVAILVSGLVTDISIGARVVAAGSSLPGQQR